MYLGVFKGFDYTQKRRDKRGDLLSAHSPKNA
jgi:hypothetical protein